MKKLMLAGVVVVLAVVLIWARWGSKTGSKTASDVSGSGSARGSAASTAAGTMSEELRSYLYDPYSTLNISPPVEIHAYARHQMTSGIFGHRGLRYQIDPDVQGTIEVVGRHGVTWASVLDDFCRDNQCRWDVSDPRTIRIRRRPAG